MDNQLTDAEIQEMLNKYPHGSIDSPTDLRDYTYDMISEVSNVEIPNEFELQYQFKLKNQGQIGACVSYAISEAKEMIDNSTEYYSQWWLHALRNNTDYQGKGAIIREELKHLVNDGIVPLNMFNVVEDYSQIKDTLETKYDKNLLLQEANKHKSTGYISLNKDEIKKYLYTEKKPIIFAVSVWQNFYQAPYNNGIIPSNPVGSNSYGNHCMVIVGYKDDMLKILNSWGDWGGQNGYLYLDVNSPIIKELWGLTDKPIEKPPVKTYRTGWDKNSNGKWIYSKDGESLVTNDWLQWNGKWYFLGTDSTMQIEWYKDSKGRWFYLDIDKGYAYCDCWVFIHSKWYHFDKSCAMQTGWFQDTDGKWYYLDIDKGYMYADCTILIDSKNYTFNSSGARIQNNRIKGIDVSNNNGSIDFSGMSNDGVEIVYLKATEGQSFKDGTMETFYADCKANGLKVGAYHFLVGTSTPETQAQNFYEKIKDFEWDCIPMCDVETSFNGLANYLERFVATFNKLSSLTLGIYSYTSFLDEISDAESTIKDMPFWEANYNNSPWSLSDTFFTNRIGHQYTDQGVISGITSEGCDVDSFTNGVYL